jgi:hypothetical protein
VLFRCFCFPVLSVTDPPVQLHNRLLLALLKNASAPANTIPSPTLTNLRKRRRLNVDDPEFDVDPNSIEQKGRVQAWVMGLTGRERARIRRAVVGKDGEGDISAVAAVAGGLGAADSSGILGDDGGPFDQKRKRWSNFAPSKLSFLL